MPPPTSVTPPNADKASQVREQRGLTRFMILPDVFLCRFLGWDRSRLKEFQVKWKKHHTPTPFETRRFATFRDQEQACASRLWLGQKGGVCAQGRNALVRGQTQGHRLRCGRVRCMTLR